MTFRCALLLAVTSLAASSVFTTNGRGACLGTLEDRSPQTELQCRQLCEFNQSCVAIELKIPHAVGYTHCRIGFVTPTQTNASADGYTCLHKHNTPNDYGFSATDKKPYDVWWPPPPPAECPDERAPSPSACLAPDNQGTAVLDTVAPTVLSMSVTPHETSFAAHILLDEAGTVFCAAATLQASPTVQEIRNAGFQSTTLHAAVPVTVMVTGLSQNVNFYILCCVAEDLHNNTSPFLRMLPVTLSHTPGDQVVGGAV